jgi:hypothetical protein
MGRINIFSHSCLTMVWHEQQAESEKEEDCSWIKKDGQVMEHDGAFFNHFGGGY